MSYQPTSSFSQPSPLSSSVSSLRSSVFLLSSCNDILTQSTNDLPRLRNVLSQTRHFELTPAYKLQQAQESLASELAPAIEQLLSRVERECEKVERKEEGARARAELLSGRIGNGGRDEVSKRAAPKRSARQSMAAGAGGEKALRLRMLKQKRDRLNYAVERLTLQSQQRQRQLRMSVNVPRLED